MLSEKLLNSLNDQMNFEYESANIYLAMSAYCASQNLEGFAHFLKVQVDEERFHASKFYNYINDIGGRVLIKGYSDPSNDYESILDVFEKALEHEKKVTKRIYDLMDIATSEKHYPTISFLNWFIDEQVEEEATFEGYIQRLRMIGDNSSALYLLNNELAERVFTPAE